jgi:hypothetical protein
MNSPIYRIADGRVAENWHVEDNLTLQQQLGNIADEKSKASR